MQEKKEKWSGQLGFVLACAGSAVGLGNIWRFPYVLGQEGGGAFLFIYLLCVIGIGGALMLAEMYLGQRFGRAHTAYHTATGGHRFLSHFGALGALASLLIVSFYGIVGGWTIHYFVYAVQNFGGESAEQITGHFGQFISGATEPIVYAVIFFGITFALVVLGVQKGLDPIARYGMPLLFLLLLVLMVRAFFLPGAGEGLSFLFKPDFSKLSFDVVRQAVTHALFTLSIGIGILLTFASYTDKKTDLIAGTLAVVVIDTVVSIVSAMIIMPILFTYGKDPASGPGLVFVSVPTIFAQMGSGVLLGGLFFALLFLAAVTSAISLLDNSTAYLMDKYRISRGKTLSILLPIVGILAIASSYSFGPFSHLTLANILHIQTTAPFFNYGVFDLLDSIGSNILLLIGGISLCIILFYFGGAPRKQEVIHDLSEQNRVFPAIAEVWYFIGKYVVPLVMLAILVYYLYTQFMPAA